MYYTCIIKYIHTYIYIYIRLNILYVYTERRNINQPVPVAYISTVWLRPLSPGHQLLHSHSWLLKILSLGKQAEAPRPDGFTSGNFLLWMWIDGKEYRCFMIFRYLQIGSPH